MVGSKNLITMPFLPRATCKLQSGQTMDILRKAGSLYLYFICILTSRSYSLYIAWFSFRIFNESLFKKWEKYIKRKKTLVLCSHKEHSWWLRIYLALLVWREYQLETTSHGMLYGAAGTGIESTSLEMSSLSGKQLTKPRLYQEASSKYRIWIWSFLYFL